MKTVYIYTDGACRGNPGPGGWAAILVWGQREKELSDGEALTTNNRMELLAAIRGLEALKERCHVVLYSDSKYLVDAVTLGRRRTEVAPRTRTFGRSYLPCSTPTRWRCAG